MSGGAVYLHVLFKQLHRVIGVLSCIVLLDNVQQHKINGTECFFFFSQYNLWDTNEVNLFDKFRYNVLLTYFSEVVLGRLDWIQL